MSDFDNLTQKQKDMFIEVVILKKKTNFRRMFFKRYDLNRDLNKLSTKVLSLHGVSTEINSALGLTNVFSDIFITENYFEIIEYIH